MNFASESSDGESLLMRIGDVIHAPKSIGKNSLCGVRFHLRSPPLSLPKISACVYTFWKHKISSCLFSSFMACRNSSLYAYIPQ